MYTIYTYIYIYIYTHVCLSIYRSVLFASRLQRPVDLDVAGSVGGLVETIL